MFELNPNKARKSNHTTSATTNPESAINSPVFEFNESGLTEPIRYWPAGYNRCLS